MPHQGEGLNISVINEEIPKEEKKEQREKVKVRCRIFFDGTLNNVKNINQRLACAPENKLKDDEKDIAKEIKGRMTKKELALASKYYEKYGAKNENEENSYEGFYTNVVKMEKCIKENSKYDYSIKSYIEGAGSINFEQDKVFGYAFALCYSGVKNKVKKAIEDVVLQITSSVDSDVVIDEISIDVFGFSRGAAQARNFIYEILYGDENKPIKEQVESKGYIVNDINVEFVGLYDTVSTYGLWVAFGAADNVKELHLDAVRYAKQVVHLASADEHREYFSLTNINSASTGIEIFLPGVHSDIGGGYRDDVNEKKFEINWTLSEKYADDDCRKLIEEGWYDKEQLTKDVILSEDGDSIDEVKVFAQRGNIKNSYSLIPLHIMAKYAKKSEIMFLPEFDVEQKIPAALDEAKKNIYKYINNIGIKQSKLEDWSLNSVDWNKNKSWLTDLRRKYCHFSAKYKIGHTPRMSFWGGERYRKIYSG